MPDARTVLIVEDHPELAEAIKTLVDGSGRFRVVGSATTGSEAVVLAGTYRPALLTLDLSLPDGGGLALLNRLRIHAPDTRVLILSMQVEAAVAAEAFNAGARGYVGKDSLLRDLVRGLEAVDRGEFFLSPTVTRTVLAGFGVSR